MSLLPIRYVSFDCYGTLVDFRVGDVARDRLADRVPPEGMAAFLEDFTVYRFDEVLGAWKPYPEVLHGSLERTCRRWGVAFDPADAQAIIEAVPSWGRTRTSRRRWRNWPRSCRWSSSPMPPTARSAPTSTSWTRRFMRC
jgi:FMN phosphatase YigB (HAD superfamily)